jgi:hypothetical protein
MKANAVGKNQWTMREDTLSLIRQLARQMHDWKIARVFNRAGTPTGRGNGWTEERVRSFRGHHDIAVYRECEWAERGEITLDAAAQIIGVTTMTALRMIHRGDIKARQLSKGAPWAIRAHEVAAFRSQKRTHGRLTSKSAQQRFDFQ